MRESYMAKNNYPDPLPEHFASIKEASDFWDTHDAGEYEQYLRPLDITLEVDEQLPQAVLIEYSLSEALKRTARGKGISLETLVNLWLEQRLMESQSHG
jgi:hypothetical protein